MSKAWIPLCLLTVACSSVSSNPPSDVERQVEELKSRVVALQQQAAVDKMELENLHSRLQALEARLPPKNEVRGSRRGVGIVEENLGIVEENLGIVEENLGIDEENLAPPIDEVAIEESDLEELPIFDIAAQRPNARPPSDSSSQDLGAAAQELYDRGYTLHHQGRYFEAEEAFSRFLGEYGDSDLADNAHYWIGESRVGRGELQSALAAFRDTVRLYPRGNKAPDALYKTGVLLERLGDLGGARDSYLGLLSDYPLSPLTDQAQARLDRL